MGFAFNPFTGNFDVKGAGGGGGSAFFAGEVPTYADLPLDGTAALNSRWLVRSNSGTWPFSSYKQAGVYVRIATVGSSRDNDYRLTDTSFFDVMSDAAFLIYDDGDATKNLKFQLSGIPTASTVTLTAPAASGTIARTETFAAPPSIGNTTPAAGTFTTLAATGDGTINGFVIGASSISSTGGSRNYQTNSGEGLVAVVSGAALAAGTNAARFAAFSNNRCGMRPEGELGWASSGAPSSSNFDVILRRDAAGVLSQYNGSNGQTYRLYNTYTDASNHERLSLRWASNVAIIGTEKAGTGSARALEFQTDGTTRLTISTGGSVTAAGTLTGGPIQSNAGVRVAATSQLEFGASGSRISNQASGVLTLHDSALSNFGRLQFGGTTSSFPALKRSSTTLQVRLADDSDFAPLSCGALTLNGNLDASTRDLVTDTTTGTKIGTATTQKLGFFNATPVVQQAAVADATDAASTQARLNDLLARVRTLGLIAT